jgi:hypothetical protein
MKAILDFIRPKWKNSNPKVRLDSVRNLTDESALAYVARNDSATYVRLEAAEKLSDQTKVQSIYVEIANSTFDPLGYRVRAIMGITDQNVLFRIAKQDVVPGLSLAAADQMSDPSLAQVIYSHIVSTKWKIIDPEAIQSAIDKLTDQAILAELALSKLSEYIRLRAAERLVDAKLKQSVYSNVVKTARKGIINIISEGGVDVIPLLRKITDQSYLADIARNASNDELRLEAAKMLSDKVLASSVFAHLVKTAKEKSVRVGAIEEISDQSILVDLAMCINNAHLVFIVTKRITDQSLLTEIVKSAMPLSLRIAAVKLITKDEMRELLLDDLFQSMLEAAADSTDICSDLKFLCDFAEQFPHKNYLSLIRNDLPPEAMKKLCCVTCIDTLFTSNDVRESIARAKDLLFKIGGGNAEKEAMISLAEAYAHAGEVSVVAANIARRLLTKEEWLNHLSPSDRNYIEKVGFFSSNITHHLD